MTSAGGANFAVPFRCVPSVACISRYLHYSSNKICHEEGKNPAQPHFRSAPRLRSPRRALLLNLLKKRPNGRLPCRKRPLSLLLAIDVSSYHCRWSTKKNWHLTDRLINEIAGSDVRRQAFGFARRDDPDSTKMNNTKGACASHFVPINLTVCQGKRSSSSIKSS
jgi:hypothetical protein